MTALSAWGRSSSRSFQVPAADQDGVIRCTNLRKGDLPADPCVGPRLHPGFEDEADFHVQDVLGKPVFGHAEPRHAAQGRTCLEDRHLVAEEARKIGKRQSCRSPADHRDLLARPLHPHGLPDPGPVGHIGSGPFEPPDIDRFVPFPAVAVRFARVGADSARRSGKGISGPQKLQGLLIPVFLHQAVYLLDGVSCRTGGLAGRCPGLILQTGG